MGIRHMSICLPPLMTAMSTYGMPWRETIGIFITIMGNKMRKDVNAMNEMKKDLSDAEEILSNREIKKTSDLNLGDLAIFFETSLPFFILPAISYEDYPALKNLYKIMQQIPEFEEIDQKFDKFTGLIRDLRRNSDSSPSPTTFTFIGEIWTSMKLF